jgi:hypothetical protein
MDRPKKAAGLFFRQLLKKFAGIAYTKQKEPSVTRAMTQFCVLRSERDISDMRGCFQFSIQPFLAADAQDRYRTNRCPRTYQGRTSTRPAFHPSF